MSNIAECARHLKMSERRYRELLDQGVIGRKPSGQYSLTRVRERYIEHLRTLAAGRAGKDSTLTDERAGWTKARRLAAERENQIAAGQYVAGELVGQFLEKVFSIVREHLLALPGVNGYELAANARQAPSEQAAVIVVTEKLHAVIFAALEELSDGEIAGQKFADLEKTINPLPPAAEPPNGGAK